MTILKEFRTIPQLFELLTEEYSKTIKHPLLKYKVDKQWVDVTYSQFKEEVETFGTGLASIGIKRGDKIAIISENRPEWVYSDMAILSIGAIDVPIYPSLTSNTIEFILNNSDAIAVIVSNKLQLNKILKVRHSLKHIRHIIVFNEKDVLSSDHTVHSFKNIQNMGKIFREQNPNFFKESIDLCKENDLCTIIYTSGTTGEPKGVMLTHKNIVSNILDALRILPVSSEDTLLSFLPLCHIFERTAGYYVGFACGAMIYYAQSIETVAKDMFETKPTIITTVPRLFERMHSKIIKNIDNQSNSKQNIFYWAIETGRKYKQAERDGNIPINLSIKHKIADKLVLKKLRLITGGKLRFFFSGGAALGRELAEFFDATGITILEGYGLTETSPAISLNRLDNNKFGTVGRPLPSVEIKIANDGEILVRGPNIMQGYYKNKKESDEVLKDGWFHTGDIGVFDAEGFLHITDRKKYLFKTSGGKYIAPTPIENMFLASKYIDQFVLIGDRKMFLSALIVPDFDAISEYADSHNIYYSNITELVQQKEIYDLIEKEMAGFQKSLSSFERVRKFSLLDSPFSLEDGEMTPSLKIRRKIIEERYRNLIEGMYKG
jgi:long-chain acyl-CoA synthetase